jgi:hypothetical protein
MRDGAGTNANPAPPATGTTNGGSVRAFVERWQEIRTEVKAADRKVEALLASTDPHHVLDGTLYLLAAYPFHVSKLNEDRNRAIIEDAVSRITGHRMSVMTAMRDDLPAVTPDPAPDPAPSQPPAGRQVAEAQRPDDTESYQAGDGSDDDNEAGEQQVMERMKAIFNGEEVDIDDLPIDLDPT